jgi:hypothetical protein
MPTLLRWLLIVPSALSAYAYVRLVAYFAGFLSGDQNWCPLFGHAFAAFFMVLAGAQMAPRRRIQVSIVLIVAHWLILNALKPELGLPHNDWLNSASRLLSITGALLAAYCVFFDAQTASINAPRTAPIPDPELETPRKPTQRLPPSGIKLPALTNNHDCHATTIFLLK